MGALHHTPIGLSARPPMVAVFGIDRAALMRRAHAIAAKARPYMADYRKALAYGLSAAWGEAAVRKSFATLRAQVSPRQLSAAQIAASRYYTRRVGSSWT